MYKNDEYLNQIVIEKLVKDPSFLLWLKNHYHMSLKITPIKVMSVDEDRSLDQIVWKFEREYYPVIKKKKLNIAEKISYYVKDMKLCRKENK